MRRLQQRVFARVRLEHGKRRQRLRPHGVEHTGNPLLLKDFSVVRERVAMVVRGRQAEDQQPAAVKRARKRGAPRERFHRVRRALHHAHALRRHGHDRQIRVAGARERVRFLADRPRAGLQPAGEKRVEAVKPRVRHVRKIDPVRLYERPNQHLRRTRVHKPAGGPGKPGPRQKSRDASAYASAVKLLVQTMFPP